MPRHSSSPGSSAMAATGTASHSLEEGGAELTPALALSLKQRFMGQSREPQCCPVLLPPFFQNGVDEAASSISASL